jgi:Short C-terminal domain
MLIGLLSAPQPIAAVGVSRGGFMFAADYPFLDVFWTLIVFFLWVMWFWLLFTVWGDIFRRDDISGWAKTGWLIFTIVLPFLGVFVYLVSQNRGMTERNIARARAQRAQFDDYVREAAGGGGGSAAEIEKAKALLDSGAISQAEFDALKQKALG